MNVHKRQRISQWQRKALWKDWQSGGYTKVSLSEKYQVSWVTVNKYIQRGRQNEFEPRKSINKRYRCLEYGVKRLAKIEAKIEERLKQKAKRYEKSYPGEMLHFDTKLLPRLEGEDKHTPREYLFVAIDDYSRELFAAVMPDKTQYSASKFLEQVIEECGYTIECAYSDNGVEYKGSKDHAFVKLCRENNIKQGFTRPKTPKTNGKAERVLRTSMDLWHHKEGFQTRAHRKVSLLRFLNYYNHVKPHKSLIGHLKQPITPYERLCSYFFPLLYTTL